MMFYAQDYDSRWPVHDFSQPFQTTNVRAGFVVDDWAASPRPNFAAGIQPYVKNRDVFICPENNGWLGDSDKTRPPTSYVYNGYAMGRTDGETQQPASVALIYDVRYITSWAAADPSGNLTQNWGITWFQDETLPAHLLGTPSAYADYFKGMYNVAFQDGHAKALRGDTISDAICWRVQPPDNLFFY